ncbi:MAG: MASE1 domain-containing protein [Proteobacteria bacterium]|nr:MASE1 domain-containing protein [Pseudomonadota bacterium]
MHRVYLACGTALAYLVLAGLSALLAYSQADAWTVWFANGVTLGLLLALRRSLWPAVLAGVFVAALVFELFIGSSLPDAIGYALIELVTALLGAWLASLIARLPLRLESPRELAATLAGALLLALTGALIATAWSAWSHTDPVRQVFHVWFTSNLVGALLTTPLIVSWLQFRAKRSGGLPAPAFIVGAVGAVLFIGGLMLVFATGGGRGLKGEFAYLPVLFLALVALMWGTRGATLVALLGALLATACTVAGRGPFVDEIALPGDGVLEVQVYATAMALTGLLIAVLSAAQRRALNAARDWQTRFEAAIGAHRLLAYEWDPRSGRLSITGDAQALLGVAPQSLRSLADWLALVRGDDRDRVNARFELRAQGDGSSDTLDYDLARRDGTALTISDESRAIRDHDGTLHRIVGIVRAVAA